MTPSRTTWLTGLALAAAMVATSLSATAAPISVAQPVTDAETATAGELLPAPPAPAASKPTASPRVTKRTSEVTSLGVKIGPAAKPVVKAASNGNPAPGANTSRKTLIVYDSTGDWGWLGEAYAVQTGNLVSHGSPYVMHPVGSYTAGEMAAYTGVVYLGSTYDEPLPVAFLDDVLSGTKPVVWMNHNIWQLAQRAADFTGQYGWNWAGFDFGAATSVSYEGATLSRDPLAVPSGLMVTSIFDSTKAQSLATANGSAYGPISWATKSGNLTYLGEMPFSYVGHGDRYLAAADILSQLADPTGPDRKRALVRIEDVGPDADPAELRAVADYLSAQQVPFSIAVYPMYKNPLGINNGGVPQSYALSQRPQVVNALKYMRQKGGTLLMHGYTHQFGTTANPYDGESANDFEFYLAHVDANNSVIYDGPVPGDSASWAQGRVDSAKQEFTKAGLSQPTIFEPPHYAASAVDYEVFQTTFGKRYDRGLYFGGYCPNGVCGTGTPLYNRLNGQYFPYLVRDIYGSVVIPEALGNVEPEPFNNHPARLPADIVATAQALSVVNDGVASFFYHPYLGVDYLQQTVTGIKAAGFQFVSAGTVAAG